MKRYAFQIMILFMAFLTGCGKDTPVLIVENVSWPDGTVVSVIQDGKIVDRSTLYGDYVRLRAEKPGQCRIRAGKQHALTWLSEDVVLMDGENRIPLPAPSARRRAAGSIFGFSVAKSCTGAVHDILFKNPVPGVTTITVPYDVSNADDTLNDIATTAHDHAVELLVPIHLNTLPEDRHSERLFPDMLNRLETAGVDGVLLAFGSDITTQDVFLRFVRSAASEIHLRGMTLTLAAPDSWPGDAEAESLFRDVPSPEMPDMIMIPGLSPSEKNISPDTVLHIERCVDRLISDGVPQEKIAAECTFSAWAFAQGQNGEYSRVPLERGVLERILPVAGKTAVLRLRNGTLRLGYGGRVFSFDDIEGLAGKLRRLRKSPFAPRGGIHIRYDGTGITLDRDGLKQLSEIYCED